MMHFSHTHATSVFRHPEPLRLRPNIVPVFLPFSGCPSRCVYCQQSLATGRKTTGLQLAYTRLEKELSQRHERRNPPLELAFYGGTFTSLPGDWTWRFLDLAGRFRELGLVSAIRCSTRPDAVSDATLARLAASGLDLVELGVQSFDDQTLDASARGYTGAVALDACARVRDHGLSLGVQLLPGLPGMTRAAFLADVAQTCRIAPDTVRLYPCQVLQGTELEHIWAAGDYAPWGLNSTVELLSQAVLCLWRAGVRVIRQGLASEPAMLGGRLAGPWHPALGQMIRSRALHLHLANHIAQVGGPSVRALSAPRASQGEFWGQRNELLRAYARLGLRPDNVSFVTQNIFIMYYET